MDATDGDKDWGFEPGVHRGLCRCAASKAKEVEVVIDSGADVSVAPLSVTAYDDF